MIFCKYVPTNLIGEAKKLNSITIFIQLFTLVPTKINSSSCVFVASVFNVEARTPFVYIAMPPKQMLKNRIITSFSRDWFQAGDPKNYRCYLSYVLL